MTDLGLGGLIGLYALVSLGAVVPVVPTGALVSAGAVLAAVERPWEIVLVVAVLMIVVSAICWARVVPDAMLTRNLFDIADGDSDMMVER